MKKDDKKQEEEKDSKKIEELSKKAQECEDKYKRALADYQNLEKRSAEERKEWIRIANKELILRLLPVLDTLMMASGHVKDEGLVLSIKQFLGILEREGAEIIETIGKEFNPELMEAVEILEGEEGKVLGETRVGFTLNGKVLRPALVKVGRKSELNKNGEMSS
ncbi:MAG: nucleotide exchange factor GrpE [bacterium]|nr:nucleotide exchange factor GrpE [bacterium]